VWTLAKDRDMGTRASVAHAVLDFRVGYIATGVLAFVFLMLGAGVMYGSGTSFSAAGTQFSLQLVDLYSATLGAWTRPLVLVAVLTTMFSTALTVIDGFPRAIARSWAVLRSDAIGSGGSDTGPVYWASGAVLGLVTVLIVAFVASSLTAMVDFATIVSFLTAPILGYLNLRVILGGNMPAEHRPGKTLIWLSYAGLVALASTAVVFLVTRL
jgi:Mn2+/Fe2+ NRAMP family transporter